MQHRVRLAVESHTTLQEQHVLVTAREVADQRLAVVLRGGRLVFI